MTQQFGSLHNSLYSRMVIGQPEPEVGMGATLLSWTDRYAATITAVNGNMISVQQDHAKRTDSNGFSEMQTYEYSRDPEGMTCHFRREKSGKWQQVRRNEKTGRWNKVDGFGLRIGDRREYRDFTF